MMTGSWELQVSIDAPDGVDNLILPLSGHRLKPARPTRHVTP